MGSCFLGFLVHTLLQSSLYSDSLPFFVKLFNSVDFFSLFGREKASRTKYFVQRIGRAIVQLPVQVIAMALSWATKRGKMKRRNKIFKERKKHQHEKCSFS
jgi:hypothetical protein